MMKHRKPMTVLLLFCFIAAGCGAVQKSALPLEEPVELIFASGAGAWGTSLVLNSDGTFTGGFRDSNMGEQGEGYPHGTVYLSEFSGRFTNMENISENSYRMTLAELTLTQPEGETWIEDNIRYVASTAYGLEGGEEFFFYLPGTPVVELDTSFLNWWPDMYPEEERPDTLNCYGLYNAATGDGFFSYKTIV